MDIKEMRLVLRLTQDELAAIIGYSQTAISMMEHGERTIARDYLERLEKLLQENKLND